MNLMIKIISRFTKIQKLTIILSICIFFLIYSFGKQITNSKRIEKIVNQVTREIKSLQKKMQSKENEEIVIDFEAKNLKEEKSADYSYMENLFNKRLKYLNNKCNLLKNYSRISEGHPSYQYFFYKYDMGICIIAKVT